MDQRQRLLLVIALSFGFMTLMQVLFAEPAKPELASAGVDGGTTAQVAAADAGAEAVADAVVQRPAETVDSGTNAAGAPVQEAKVLPFREVERTRKEMNLRFSSEGGSLVSAQLLGPRERVQQKVSIAEGFQKLFGKKFPPPPQMEMVAPAPGQPNPFSVAIDAGTALAATARYELLEERHDSVTFRASNSHWQVDKRYSWVNGGFALALDVTVRNLTDTAQSGEMGVFVGRNILPGSEEQSSLFGGIGNEASVGCRVGDELKPLNPAGVSEGGVPVLGCGGEQKHTLEQKGPVHFTDIDMQYFLSALYVADGPKEGRCVTSALPNLRTTALYLPLQVAARGEQTFKLGAFLGPKDFELLKAASPAGLERTVDFGLWAFICKILLLVLKFFHGLVMNWGAAIILLTVSVKVLLLPLTHKAMVSAEAMKKLQPKMEEIKKKFPDDRERQNVEVMKMYQEAKVNPLGGCLPLLLQLPIWAALFTTLRTSYELYGEPFVGPVWTDLTFKDPTYLLPLALGVTMIITQRLQPQMMDKQQAFIFTWIMPVFFTAMMMNYPAGLALYIFTNNLLSILQQFLLRKYLEKKGLAAPRPPGSSKGPPGGGGDGRRLKESAS